jgi:hypothetical protein
MKNEILKRAMFAMPLTKDARNSGIMAGFEEEMPEAPEDNVDEMPQMARTPQNPEILMNTLRGDMRSVDARVQELAQLVGEEAAMETPPEVLAMLQPQLAAQQGGIGALPQGQQMAPPPMAPPPEAGMPPQGGIPMPPGMEGAGPFPQGGAEQAPPTPDGMPPMKAAFGAFVTPATRAAQFMREAAAGRINAMGEKAAQYGPAINQYLGNLTMRAQPTVQRVTGGSPPMPLSVQGREALVQGPAGTIVQGAGTQLAPYTTMGPLMTPTFTEGIKMGVQNAVQQYPRVAEALSRVSPALAMGTGAMLSQTDLRLPFMRGNDSNKDMTAEQKASYDDKMAQLAAIDQMPSPSSAQPSSAPKISLDGMASEKPAYDPMAMTAVSPSEFATQADLEAQGPEKKTTQDFIKAATKPKTRAERTKAEYEDMAPLFTEILGSDKEDMKTNALLLLADAGFKMASSRQPTAAMAISEGFAGVPRGLMALAAQDKDRELKIKTAALSQAFSTVQEEDKYIQQLTVENQKALNRAKELILKKDLEGGEVIQKDGGGGRLILEDKKGNYLDMRINPKHPIVRSLKDSRFNLIPETNPYVTERGPAPNMVVDKDALPDVLKSITRLERSIGDIDNALDAITDIYGPSAFFKDKYNKLIVPVTPLSPVLETAEKKARVDKLLNSLGQQLATETGSGKESVQTQKWVRDTLPALGATFFSDPEVAFKQFQTLKTGLLNERHERITEGGYDSSERVMKTPALGTKNDPFMVSSNPEEANRMFNFLAKTVGTVRDPNAVVFLNINNTIQPFTATKLRSLIKE